MPGLNPAIRRIASGAVEAGFKVIGIKRGWAGLIELNPDPAADNSDCYEEFSSRFISVDLRSGETFLRSSRTKPSALPKSDVPDRLRDIYNEEINDLTSVVIDNLKFLEIDYLIPIGGDDTLNYAVRLKHEGVKIVAIPKTMDGDVAGTDYCIGFSTCITRTIGMINTLRASAGSHQRFMIIEVFGRSAGFTAILPTIAGVANRCIIPEYKFDIDQLAELMVSDRARNPGNYSIVVVSEGADFNGSEQYFSRKSYNRSGVGEVIADRLHQASSVYNGGKKIDTITQNLGYLVRSGDPDAMDSLMAVSYANMALDLILSDTTGVMTGVTNGLLNPHDIDIVADYHKIVDVEKCYDVDFLCPKKTSYRGSVVNLLTGEISKLI